MPITSYIVGSNQFNQTLPPKRKKKFLYFVKITETIKTMQKCKTKYAFF